MKYTSIAASLLLLGLAAGASSCSNDDLLPGDPTMNITATLDKAFFGDSIPFTVKASDPEVALSTLRVQLYFGEELVSEKVIRTKENGADYTDKIAVPYLANIPDGNATLRMTLQNINFTKKMEEFLVPLRHPDYASLTFLADDGTEYTMKREEQYVYSMTDRFPAEMKGKIVAPAYGDNGNEITFGYESSQIKAGAEGSIPFSNGTAGKYKISFNSFSFEGSPFVILSINDQLLEPVDDTHSQIDMTLNKGDLLTPSGFPEFADWWIDPDYFVTNADGTLTFNAYTGTYRIIADMANKYFRVYKLNGSEPATLNADGTGAVWIIGNGIGHPSLANQVGWTTENAICMAPIGEKTYQTTLVAGRTIDAKSIDFKLFHQMGWGGEFGPSSLVSKSDLVLVGDKEANGHDNGNLFLADGKTLEANGVYVFTLDLQGGSGDGILTVDYKGEQQFEEKPLWINGVRMTTGDNVAYEAMLQMEQGAKVEITGTTVNDLWWADPDYFTFNEDDNSFSFNPVSGYYCLTVNRNNQLLTAKRVDAAGNDMTLSADGHGAIWIMGYGVGSPSQDSQFGWNPGKAYCMAEVAPKVYQFTGVAGPENGSSIGDRYRYDYIDCKFFHQNGWGGEFAGATALTLTGEGATFLKMSDSGNFGLSGQLEQGTRYRLTIDLSKGNNAGTINFVIL